jgi:hypothetical protein
MGKARTVEISSSLDLESCKELLQRYEEPVADRGIRFRDNLQWPDQYVVTWKDPLHFNIANWVHFPGTAPTYYEQQSWEVEISEKPPKLVLTLQRPPVNLKRNIIIFLSSVLVGVVLIIGKLVPLAYIGLGFGLLFLVAFSRTFIFEDETAYCVKFLDRILNPETPSKFGSTQK